MNAMSTKKNIATATERNSTIARGRSGDSPASDVPFHLGRWLLGWVVAPLSVLAVIFVGGVHVGARNPDLWPLEAIRWISKTAQSLFG